MATFVVRDVDEEIKSRLNQRAAKNGHSTEAEIRSLIKAAVQEPSWLSEWLQAASGFAGTELPLPERMQPRQLKI